MKTASGALDLDIALQPRWESVAEGRSKALIAIASDDESFDEYVGMIVTELLENAVRYGVWEGPTRTIRLRAALAGDSVVIIVSSPSTPLLSAVLLETLASIRRYSTARDAYEARVRELAEDGAPSGVSRLGLVRMMAEGPCDLDAEVQDSETAYAVLHVRATIRRRAS